jgi:hypothetical protein
MTRQGGRARRLVVASLAALGIVCLAERFRVRRGVLMGAQGEAALPTAGSVVVLLSLSVLLLATSCGDTGSSKPAIRTQTPLRAITFKYDNLVVRLEPTTAERAAKVASLYLGVEADAPSGEGFRKCIANSYEVSVRTADSGEKDLIGFLPTTGSSPVSRWGVPLRGSEYGTVVGLTSRKPSQILLAKGSPVAFRSEGRAFAAFAPRDVLSDSADIVVVDGDGRRQQLKHITTSPCG